jgi:beta-1,2-mannobiose phosphorylase / 1,2-beta-oligomannan phosphorylase
MRREGMPFTASGAHWLRAPGGGLAHRRLRRSVSGTNRSRAAASCRKRVLYEPLRAPENEKGTVAQDVHKIIAQPVVRFGAWPTRIFGRTSLAAPSSIRANGITGRRESPCSAPIRPRRCGRNGPQPNMRNRVFTMLRTVVAFAFGLQLFGCGSREIRATSTPRAPLTATVALVPFPARAGTETITVAVRDGEGTPVDGARVSVLTSTPALTMRPPMRMAGQGKAVSSSSQRPLARERIVRRRDSATLRCGRSSCTCARAICPRPWRKTSMSADVHTARHPSFSVLRLGVAMTPSHDPREAWGVLNPAAVRAADGALHLFPRIVAEGNCSRIGHARVQYRGDVPVGVTRLGIALEPREPYEVRAAGGGVEGPRICWIDALGACVMTYTAFVRFAPRVGVAVSTDLVSWQRLGLMRYAAQPGIPDLNLCGNKDATFFPDIVSDPDGVPSLALLHQSDDTHNLRDAGCDVTAPPCGEETRESIWISYVPLAMAQVDRSALTCVAKHEAVMGPVQPWEDLKIGAGAPPVRLGCYAMGAVILEADRPSRALHRTSMPTLEPSSDYERAGTVADVVFPTATDLCADGRLDVYYGAADRVIAVARLTLPDSLPGVS